MKFKLEFDCGNAAFDDDGWAEIAAILRRVADRADNMRGRPLAKLTDDLRVHDTNGNTVGKATLR